MTNVKMVFQKPENNTTIGGIGVVCDNYETYSDFFTSYGITIELISYQFSKNSLVRKLKSSKIKNIIYGFKQYRYLKILIANAPDSILHFHTSRLWLFRKDMLVISQLYERFHNSMFVTIHVGDISTVFSNKTEQHFFISILNRCVKKTIFLSSRMREQFIDAGLSGDRTEVLYNFCNVERTLPEEKPHTNTIVSLASINRDKGIIELLNAAKQMPANWKLYICGAIIEPSITSIFEDLLHKCKENVEFCGLIGYEKKNKLLQEADIFVLPSYREGMPISILEALNHSCAIITTPVGAIPEILIDKKNCIFVSPRDEKSLFEAFYNLLHDKKLLLDMQKNNSIISEKYSAQEHIKKLCSFYTA